MSSVFWDITAERARQDEKWGVQAHDYGVWKAILGEELGEADTEFLQLHFLDKKKANHKNFRHELVQVAAVAVAMIECGDREGWFKE